MNRELTSARLREFLHYDAETGVFTWIVSRKRARAGDVAGCPNKRGYLIIRIEGRNFYAHRLAWLYTFGRWPNNHIDHRDGNEANNAISNLRDATQAQNRANARIRANSSTGLKGVTKLGNRYRALLNSCGKQYHLGVFDTPEQAYEAYCAANIKINGEFARVA